MTKKLAVILAGGLSSRMGQEKSFLNIEKNKFLIDRVIERLKPQTDRLAINANGDAKRFAHTYLDILPDDNFIGEAVGPLMGILTALEWARKMDSEWVMTVSCDCPQLPNNLYDQLAAVIPHHDIAVAMSFGFAHPTIALWRTDIAQGLKTAIKNGVRKIDKFTADYKVARVDFTPPNTSNELADPFFNINTPSEFENWQRAQNK